MALAMHKTAKTTTNKVILKTQGGELKVKFDTDANGYQNIWLIGPAEQVFKGELQW